MVQAPQPKVRYLDVLWLHRWFAVTIMTIVLLVVFVGSKLQKEVYRVDADIYVEPKPATVTGESGMNVADYDYRMLNNQIEILGSDKVAQKAVGYIHDKLGNRVHVSEKMLQASLNIQKKEYTSVISLGLSGPFKPQDLQTMMNLYLKAYRDSLEDINSDKSSREKDFLQKQLAVSKEDLASAAAKLRDFESHNQAYNIDAQMNQMLNVASRLDEQSKTLNVEIAATSRQIAGAAKLLPNGAEYVNLMARVERDPEASDLRKRIVTLESERAEWASKVTDVHPKMVAITTELAKLNGLFQNRLKMFGKFSGDAAGIATSSSLDMSIAGDVINNRIRLDAMRARSAALNAERSQVMGSLQGVPRQAIEYASLKNDFDMAQEKVKVLQKRLDEATLMQEVSKSFTKVEILKNPTLPGMPIRPNLTRNMTAGLLLGFALALFSVFMRASMDRTLHWPFQINGLLKDELGEEEGKNIFLLPELPSKQSFGALLEKASFTVPEPYKRMIIHLENLSKENNVRRVGLLPVSAFPEGAMTTVALSLYLTELSNKLVLIDTDFSENSLSELIQSLRLPVSAGIQQGPGLSDYLAGDTEDFIDIIYPLGKTVYGSLIPSGDPVQDTGFQYSHRNLGQMEENLSPNYNFVLYSLPSIEQSYDAIAVGRTLDGVFLVAYPGISTLDQIQHAARELAAMHCRILGVMVQPV